MGDETDWLNPEEEEAWKAILGLLMLLPGPIESRLQQDAGLSLFEYVVLSALSMAPGRTLRMSELARLANGSLSRLSNVVKRLERNGWVVRSLDPDDGRYVVAALTGPGWDLVVAAAPDHVAAVRRYALAPLTTAQLRQVTAAGERIRHRIAEDA